MPGTNVARNGWWRALTNAMSSCNRRGHWDGMVHGFDHNVIGCTRRRPLLFGQRYTSPKEGNIPLSWSSIHANIALIASTSRGKLARCSCRQIAVGSCRCPPLSNAWTIGAFSQRIQCGLRSPRSTFGLILTVEDRTNSKERQTYQCIFWQENSVGRTSSFVVGTDKLWRAPQNHHSLASVPWQ